MWKDSIRNIVVIFQPNILIIVGFYVRHSATVPEISKARPNFMFICNLSKSFRDKLSLNLETRRQKCLQSQEIEQPASLLQPRSISKSSTNKMQKKVTGSLLINDQLSLSF